MEDKKKQDIAEIRMKQYERERMEKLKKEKEEKEKKEDGGV